LITPCLVLISILTILLLLSTLKGNYLSINSSLTLISISLNLVSEKERGTNLSSILKLEI
jgi:hypothetical protein